MISPVQQANTSLIIEKMAPTRGCGATGLWEQAPQNFCATLVWGAEQGGYCCAQALEESFFYGGAVPVPLHILVSSCRSGFGPYER